MKFFYNRCENNYEEIASYYPRFYRDVYEMAEIWKAQGSVLDELQDHIEQTFFNGFILTADINVIRAYEKLLGLTGTEKFSLEDRRRIILGRFNGFGHIGQVEIKAIVSSYTDGDIAVTFNGRWFLDGSRFLNGEKILTEGIVGLSVTRDINESIPLSYARQALEERLPAHLMLIITDNYRPILAKSAEKALFFKFAGECDVSSCNYIGRWYLNGAEELNGDKTFEEERTTKFEKFGTVIPITKTYKTDFILTETCEWTLNGNVLLNNKRKLAGITREEF